jgi:glycosyltransferase involved in cell wall biosynthesis
MSASVSNATLAATVADVIIDVSASDLDRSDVQRLVTGWTAPESLGAIARRVTLAVAPGVCEENALQVPKNWTVVECRSSRDRMSEALAASGCDGLPLLLLAGPVDIGCEVIGALRQCLDRDPLFGFAMPRLRCGCGCCFAGLSTHGLGAAPWVSRRVLAQLPDADLIAEIASPCLLIRSEVLANFGPLDPRFDTFAAALLHYMASARRCGFRVVLSNRALVTVDGATCAGESMPPMLAVSSADEALLNQLVPDWQRSWHEFRGGSRQRFERLASVVGARKPSTRHSLLLDMRNVPPSYNGTAQAALSTAMGFRKLQCNWDIALLANDQAIAFHDLERTFEDWPIHTRLPERPFAAALRLSQPWHIQELIDPHQISLFNVYLMLDTIAWDVVYPAPTDLEGTWRFLADHADGIVFDSEFTRQRFRERFPTKNPGRSLVTHFSFDPDEYVRTDLSGPSDEEPYVLVVGNNYDHKDVRRTVDTLVAGFPFHRIKVIGPADSASPLVTAYESGELSETYVHGLYAHARCIVLPTFYEGFGFPLVMALAYGRTVFARRSALVEELAAHCSTRGRLVMFDRRDQLVELIGRLAHGAPLTTLPIGTGLKNGRFRSWSDVAADIMRFVETLVREPQSSRWAAREHILRQLLSYRV